MKKQTKIYTHTLPLVSREYAEALDKLFPVLKAAPGISQDKLLFNAGKREVVETVLASANMREVTGDPDKLRDTQSSPSLLARILTGLQR